MSRRLGIFALTSLVGLFLMTAALILFFQEISERDLRDTLDSRNQLLASAVTSSLLEDGLAEILHPPAGQRGSALRERPVVEEFHELVSERIRGLPTFLVTFYNAEATVVYSTDRERIGDRGRHDSRVKKALGGSSNSQLRRRVGYNTLGPHGAQRDADTYRSYLPISGSDGAVEGVLEIHSDASAMLLGRTRVERTVVIGVISIAGLFYVALFLLYRQTHEALAREESERKRALEQVRAANDRLEERVAERTRELQASGAFLQSVIDGVGDPVLVINRDHEVMALNDAARALVASEQGDPTSLPCYQISHERDSSCGSEGNVCPLEQAFATGSSSRVIHNLVRKGVKRVIEVTATPLRDEKGAITGIVEVEHDITDLVATSQQLKASEQRFRDLSDTTAEYIWEVDSGARFTFVSDRVREVLGYEPSELRGRTPASLMPVEDAELLRKHFRLRGEGKPFNNLQHRSIRSDGKLVWQSVSSVPIENASGEIIGARGVCQDITDRKLAEEMLEQSEAHLRSIMDNVMDAILAFDEAGRIISVNRAGEMMFGGDAKELMGEDISGLIPDVAKAAGSQIPGQALGGFKQGRRESQGLRRDRSTFPIDLWIGRMELDDELRYLALVRDATEAKRVERELQQARLQYYHQEKIASIGQLAAGILHEVNNPIAAISGSLEIMKMIREAEAEGEAPTPQSAELIEHTEMIEQQVRRLSRVTQEIANFASPMARDWEVVDLNEVVRATLRLMRYDRRLRNLELRADLDKMLPAVMGVADQLLQVLMNLLLNAADASESVPDRKLVIDISTAAVGDDVLVVVADNCGGMDEDVLVACTDAYFTTKQAGKGTGLGLAICESIVSRHGGSMQIESEKGEGTTVRIRISTQAAEG